MKSMLDQMLRNYDATTADDRRNVLREVAQEVILCGLSRAGFFSEAAFYGGTALRIFYGLDRFSEDMDFSLKKPDPAFELERYLPLVERECAAWGLRFDAAVKEKDRGSAIRSAFLKGNTTEHLLTLFPDDGVADSVAPGELVRIKVEIDVDPAPFAAFQQQYRLLPSPYEVSLYDEPSLFAGKVHAVICKAWKSRVKGRDLYDYVFYRSRGTRINLRHLQAKLAQSGRMAADAGLSIGDVEAMLDERFGQIDFEQAKQDVAPFLRDARSLDVWSAGFFKAISSGLEPAD